MVGGAAFFARHVQDIMDIHVDDLPQFVFLQNPADSPFHLEYGALESCKDLFFFLFDLFCKGLVLLFSEDGRSLDITTVTPEQFQVVSQKLSAGGIHVTIQVVPAQREPGAPDGPMINMPQLAALPDDAPLDQFKVRIIMGAFEYGVSFEVSRVVPQVQCR